MFVLVTNWCSEFRLGTWICLYLDQIGAVNSDMESGYVCTRNKLLRWVQTWKVDMFVLGTNFCLMKPFQR